MPYQHIEVSPIAGALGAEVTGVDLSEDQPDNVLGEVRQALLDNLVIVFRDQELTPEQQLRFARRWGDIHLHPFMKGMDDYPEVLEIIKTEKDERNFGGGWHSDQMFSPQPAMGTMLYALEVPKAGGDTLFTNQYKAYEALSDGMKAMLDGLKTVCEGAVFQDRRGRDQMQTRDPGNVQTTSVHPLIRTHPETGRKALFIGGHVQRFDGMTDAESRPLIDFLMAHSTRPEFQLRVNWKKGSMTFWDNRCTQHHAINDYPGQRRHMRRITVCGDTPY